MTDTGLNGTRKSGHLSRKALEPWWVSGFHIPQPTVCFTQLFCIPHPSTSPTLSCLFVHSLPVPLGRCPCLCLLFCPSVVFTTHPVAPLTPVPCLSAPGCPWCLTPFISPHSVHPLLPHLPSSTSLLFSPTLGYPRASCQPRLSAPGIKSNRTPTKPWLPVPVPSSRRQSCGASAWYVSLEDLGLAKVVAGGRRRGCPGTCGGVQTW